MEAPLEPQPSPAPAPPLSLTAWAVILPPLVFFVFVFLGAPAQLLSIGWGLWFAEVFVFLCVPWVALRLMGRDPVRVAGLDGLAWGAVGFGAIVGLCSWLGGAAPLMGLSQLYFPEKLVELFDGAAVMRDRGPIELAIIVAGVSIAAPLCEEFFFRGVVQRGLVDSLGPARGIFLTAFLFSAFHLDPVGFAARFELGVVFGVLAWKGKSIWPGVAAHAANNLASSIAFLTSGPGDEEPVTLATVGALLGVGIVSLVVLVALARRFPVLTATPKPWGDPLGERYEVFRALLPWAFAAVVSLAGLLLVDFRGVRLSLYETAHAVPRPKKRASDEEKAAWETLQALRRQARAGDVPLDTYLEARARAAKAVKADE